MATVLIVDDSPDMRALMVAIVARSGHTVLEAADTESARRKLVENPDLIFLDVDMPQETGVAMLIRLRVSDPGFNTPVVFVTAHPERAEGLRKRGGGPVDVIAKPFRNEDILQALRRHLS